MNYVIADIHGEITKLRSLIRHILSEDDNPSLIFIGDYIDKGEDSFTTLEYLLELDRKYHCVFLWGNHEYYWMNTAQNHDYLIKYGALKTVESFGKNSILETQTVIKEHFKLLFEKFKYYYIIQNYFIVHSGISPLIHSSLEDIENINSEFFLFNRYDFLKVQNLFFDKYKVIFGHTGFYEPYVDDYKIGIDTSACYLEKQPLTAFCIEKEMFINSDRNISFLKDYPLNCCPVIVRAKPWRL